MSCPGQNVLPAANHTTAPAISPSILARVVALVRSDVRRAENPDASLASLLADPELVGVYLEQAVEEENGLLCEMRTEVSPRGRALRRALVASIYVAAGGAL